MYSAQQKGEDEVSWFATGLSSRNLVFTFLLSLVLEDGIGVGEGVQGSAEKVGEPEGLQPVVVGRRGQAALRSHDTR